MLGKLAEEYKNEYGMLIDEQSELEYLKNGTTSE